MSSARPTVPSKCLHCETELASPIVCTECKTLYPPSRSSDYFDLLGLERRYAVDRGQIVSAFRTLARNVHPDRFTGQPNEVQTLATQLSAEINQAVAVLNDPVQRAAYMLESAGGPSAAKLREVPGNLLAEVVMLQEQIEEARTAGDHQQIAELRSSLSTRRKETLGRIAERADQLTTASDDKKNEFRRLLNSIKYLDNLLDEVAADPLAQEAGANDG